MAAGVLKGAKVYPQNPAQYYADLDMLTHTPQFQSVFFDSSGCVKKVECIRVHGATDRVPHMRRSAFGGQLATSKGVIWLHL